MLQGAVRYKLIDLLKTLHKEEFADMMIEFEALKTKPSVQKREKETDNNEHQIFTLAKKFVPLSIKKKEDNFISTVFL